MSVVLFGGEKGGSGKSTLAVSYAAMLAGKGRDVLLVDADTQASATLWVSIRAAEEVKPAITCVSIFGDRLDAQVRALIPKYDDIVIDTRGADSPEVRSAMLVAGIIVTPAQTSQFDIYTFAKMDKLVEQARGFNHDLQAIAIMNRVPTNAHSSEAADMRESLSGLRQYRLLRAFLSERKAFRRVASEGRAVTEFESPDPKAIDEMVALGRIIENPALADEDDEQEAAA